MSFLEKIARIRAELLGAPSDMPPPQVVATALPGVHFLDIHDAICDVRNGLCGPVLPGWFGPSHRDNHHLSHEGSFSLWPRFRELFQSAGLT